CQKYSGSPFTF
nr:immunoglobulin light chain junction region [Macaca mulatta]